jgi:hypothetical protein
MSANGSPALLSLIGPDGCESCLGCPSISDSGDVLSGASRGNSLLLPVNFLNRARMALTALLLMTYRQFTEFAVNSLVSNRICVFRAESDDFWCQIRNYVVYFAVLVKFARCLARFSCRTLLLLGKGFVALGSSVLQRNHELQS